MTFNSDDSVPASSAVTALLAALPMEAALGQRLRIYVAVTGRTIEDVVSTALSNYLAATTVEVNEWPVAVAQRQAQARAANYTARQAVPGIAGTRAKIGAALDSLAAADQAAAAVPEVDDGQWAAAIAQRQAQALAANYGGGGE
jgi:hypothetical protein